MDFTIFYRPDCRSVTEIPGQLLRLLESLFDDVNDSLTIQVVKPYKR